MTIKKLSELGYQTTGLCLWQITHRNFTLECYLTEKTLNNEEKIIITQEFHNQKATIIFEAKTKINT